MTRKRWVAIGLAAAAVLVLLAAANAGAAFKGVVLWNDGSRILVADLDAPSHRYLVDLTKAKLARVQSPAGIPPGYEVHIHPKPSAEFREETHFDSEAGETVRIVWTAEATAEKLTLKNQAELALFGDAVYAYLQYLWRSNDTADQPKIAAMERMLWEIENVEMYG
jgi:hypothetical protein